MSSDRLRILIVGGYGTFGRRLAELLAGEPRLSIIIAGRSAEKAKPICARLSGRAEMTGIALDREGDVPARLRALNVDLVIDASGPFQVYGSRPYRLVEAALEAGANYLDLADSTGFVVGISRFDAAAKEKGCLVLSGLSSCPVLTAAAVRRLAEGLAETEQVIGGIAPSPQVDIGLNVVRALASYAGKPVALKRDGRTVIGYAITESRRATIGPPGVLPLRSTRFSLVDVPDLKLLPARWPELKTVWFGAGPTPGIWLRLFNALAWLVRAGVLPTVLPCAGLFHRVFSSLRWGEHRGGMFVRIQGRSPQGEPVARSWELIAEAEHGPFIPVMPAATVVALMLDGRGPKPGARPALEEVELSDLAPLFATRGIVTGVREESASQQALPLFKRLLGEAWERLPGPIRQMHTFEDTMIARGSARVDRGRSAAARLVGWLFGFPDAGQHVPLEVTFNASGGGETWQRNFAGRKFTSYQWAGSGRSDKLVCERFGPFVFSLAVVLDKDRLRLIPRRWTVLGVPLPLAFAPYGDTYEHVEDGMFHFHVEIALPVVGPIVRYRGHLTPCP